jgi:hypothetical protein
LVITTERLYFRPTFPISSNLDDISLRDIRRVERRQLQFKEIGLEIATVDDQLLLFQFSNSKDRDELFATLGRHPKLERLSVNSIELMQHRWVTGNLSTFDYLMFLNWSAGRSMNDLAQYPVIPWVLSDYTSKTIDLNDFSVYRDLSKPIGALNPSRLIQFKQRAEELRTMGEDPYLYGSHFSNPAYVAFFKVRTHPQFMLVLQGGRLDTGSRIFDSISECWSSVMTGPTDLKELIPEFYFGNGDFLRRGKLDMGFKADGSRVRRDVELPPWANEDPMVLIEVFRAALEGPYVSAHIHQWFDLVFGCLQSGADAWSAENVFHPNFYPSYLTKLADMEETTRMATESHIREFGQMPRQLFTHRHPPREVSRTPPALVSLSSYLPPDSDDLIESSGDPRGCDAKEISARCVVFVDSTERTTQEFSHGATLPECETHCSTHNPSPDSTGVVENILQQIESLEADEPTFHHEKISSDIDREHAAEINHYMTIRTTSKGKVESIAIVDVSPSAEWLFDDYTGAHAAPMVFSSDSNGVVSVTDVLQQKRARAMAKFGPAAISLIFHHRGSPALLFYSLSGVLYILDTNSCTIHAELVNLCDTAITCVCAVPRVSNSLVTATSDGIITVWATIWSGESNMPTVERREISVIEVNERVISVDVKGTRFAAATSEGTVVVGPMQQDQEHITFPAPEQLQKNIVLCSLIKDHMILLVSRFDVVILTLDGSVWSSYPAPTEVVFAALGQGGHLPCDVVILASPEGEVHAISSSNGMKRAVGRVDPHSMAEGSSICCGSVGLEFIALGDTLGRVHVLSVCDEP